MPLVNLRTSLKSLKYGHDRPDGGSSRQPYIKTDINTLKNGVITIPNFLGFDDGLIRGGMIGAANASITDTFRIGEFLLDLPKGPLFLAKQIGLQLSNPRLETLGEKQKSIFFQPTRIYNLGINTISQIPVNAFGIHFDRHGLLPIQSDQTKYENVVEKNNESGDNRLIKLAQRFNLGDNIPPDAEVESVSDIRRKIREQNRAERQRIQKINTQHKKINEAQIAGTSLLPSLLGSSIYLSSVSFKRKKPDFSQSFIDRYVGGPSSVYGIGTTTINRSSFTELKEPFDDAILNSITNAGKFLYKGERQNIDYVDIDPKSNDSSPIIANFIGELSIPAIQAHPDIFNNADYLTDTATAIMNTPRFTDYSALYNKIEAQKSFITGSSNQFGIYETNRGGQTKNGENEVINSLGTFLTTDTTQIRYTNTLGENVFLHEKYNTWDKASRDGRGMGRFDSVTRTPLFKANSTSANPSNTVTINTITYLLDDLVPFRIQAIDGDKPEDSIFMVFRAFITNLSDDINSDWNEVKYAGRGEKFYIYSGFNRKISISFKVAAQSSFDMEPMYQKLNNLIGNLMPDYTNANSGLMRGSFTKMTIGNWIENQPGIINSLSYKIPTDSPWEINIDNESRLVLPHIVEVSMTFTPIGAQTKTKNKVPNKASKNQIVSHIAQSYYGDNYPEVANYIDGKIEDGTFEGPKSPSPLATQQAAQVASTQFDVSAASLFAYTSKNQPNTTPPSPSTPPPQFQFQFDPFGVRNLGQYADPNSIIYGPDGEILGLIN